MTCSRRTFINYLLDKGCEIANLNDWRARTLIMRNPKNGLEVFIFNPPNDDRIEYETVVIICMRLRIDSPKAIEIATDS